MASDVDMLQIRVGPMTGVDSLCQRTGKFLRRFSELHERGASPEVLWDLTELRRGHVNLSTLTAFLSLAYRMKQFTAHTPRARLSNDPAILEFLTEISFLELGRRYDLWRLEENRVMGLLRAGRLNPHTNIFIFSLPRIHGSDDKREFNRWKDWVRFEVKKELLLKCAPLFQTRRGSTPLPEGIADELAITCAELVLNSVIHGKSPAFIGLQRTSARISIAVSDSGQGFRRSLQEQYQQSTSSEDGTVPCPDSDIKALLLGSLVNQQGYGVRRSINMVIGAGGWVEMSSGDGQIVWRAAMWDAAVCAVGDDLARTRDVANVLGPAIARRDPHRRRDQGSYEQLPYGLRGTRVNFEIPIGL